MNSNAWSQNDIRSEWKKPNEINLLWESKLKIEIKSHGLRRQVHIFSGSNLEFSQDRNFDPTLAESVSAFSFHLPFGFKI